MVVGGSSLRCAQAGKPGATNYRALAAETDCKDHEAGASDQGARLYNIEGSRFMSKVCAVCGQEADSDAIECSKCGRGVFVPEKDQFESKSMKNASHTPDMLESRSMEGRKHASFWKKFFARKGQPKDQSQEHYPKTGKKQMSHNQQQKYKKESSPLEIVGEELRSIFHSALTRLYDAEANSPQMITLLDQIRAMFIESFQVIFGKVLQTLSDGQMHSWGVHGGGVIILYIYTLPCTYENARAWLARGTPPTYTELLARICTGSYVAIAREAGAKALVHLIICADHSGSPIGLHLCIFPFKGTGPAYKIVLPWDLMSEDERRDWEREATKQRN